MAFQMESTCFGIVLAISPLIKTVLFNISLMVLKILVLIAEFFCINSQNIDVALF